MLHHLSLAVRDIARAAGGCSSGEPGIWPAYGSGYYAAFVIDPDGLRLEAVINSGAA